ncbi:conserved Plasmodium protein, unknown function [Plasmodium vivax]|uniref:CHCH domain-containing protein n=6 Tax=Plasmodium vivax TaxID=5855 RepID=A5KA68_PLAVS|nr:hypothetical protein PVX_087851 [Plasmodium vivax]KMZ83118.1 hypothetical protein PVIIG_04000 [Plasmodium vivax India VII]KMZ89448.1 hypothetical protein PVBG_03169 [Plasmodium vivax Brazil I]KMZ95811.1 hypothetical protein PVMG_03885 [Plasmodium vivax Mauritania I]KNA02524.1 hypothetical protein PVNG_05262 [Plasmodium vivax North Korean]EDL43704.1 hypothetical protein PVX_087851 [Plasmodium vivax]|eukprot:XP_001613431.1 hypothetical protein [Plasmodium vivax Sal-1]
MKEYTNEHNDDKGEVAKCESEYSALLECLDTFDRNWAKCQSELKTFRACYSEESGQRSGSSS